MGAPWKRRFLLETIISRLQPLIFWRCNPKDWDLQSRRSFSPFPTGDQRLQQVWPFSGCVPNNKDSRFGMIKIPNHESLAIHMKKLVTKKLPIVWTSMWTNDFGWDTNSLLLQSTARISLEFCVDKKSWEVKYPPAENWRVYSPENHLPNL